MQNLLSAAVIIDALRVKVCVQLRLKPACSATQTGKNIEIWHMHVAI